MEELADDPAIVEHIGEVTSSETDLGEAISLSNNDENVAVMVFTVKGDKGSGKVIHRTNNETGETTTTLVMDNGDEYPLQSPQNFGGVETEIEELDQIDSVDVTEMEAENETSEEEQTETETE